MQKQTQVWAQYDEVEAALTRLGVPLKVLQEAVQSGFVARIFRTSNDAPGAAGYYQWNETLRSLRENMALNGWRRSDKGGWPTTVHPDRLLAIAVSSGNQNTGLAHAVPSTKSAKGPRTMDAVDINADQPWIPGLEPAQPEMEEQNDYPTWFLMFQKHGQEIRSELSLPVNIGRDGYIDYWQERIILPSLPTDPVVIPQTPDFGPDIDIKISKKG